MFNTKKNLKQKIKREAEVITPKTEGVRVQIERV